MDEARLREIEARAQAAPPGPFRTDWGGDDLFDPAGRCVAEVYRPEDRELFAHARQDVPALAADVRRLRAALREIADSSTAYHQSVLDDVRRIAREALAFTGDVERERHV